MDEIHVEMSKRLENNKKKPIKQVKTILFARSICGGLRFMDTFQYDKETPCNWYALTAQEYAATIPGKVL